MGGVEVSGGKVGVQAAVAGLHQAGEAVPGDQSACEQVELFPLSPAAGGARAREICNASRGVGRPSGSINKNTAAWRDYILSRYSSPLVALAEIAFRPVKDLATELGFETSMRRAKPEELLDMVKVQMAAAKELLPYVHGKMPTEVDIGDKGLISLIINTGTEIKQNQGLTDLEFIESNDEGYNVSVEGSDNAE